MKLVKASLLNFRGYKEAVSLNFDQLTTLIGKNDVGKSTFLEALEIFFNNKMIKAENEDLNVDTEEDFFEITCEFTDLPTEIIIDDNNPTTLTDEYLLNMDDNLEITKRYTVQGKNPKEEVFINCYHPSSKDVDDLLLIKHEALKKRAEKLGLENFDARKSAEIRHAIWNSIDDLNLEEKLLDVKKEDCKRIYEKIDEYLPLYALFRSDRPSTDDDKEIKDPMDIAIDQALDKLSQEVNTIKERVREEAINTANRTLEALQGIDIDLASELSVEFKSEPKFNTLFKLTINSEKGIPINKRGSGVRRLILLGFFRAEAKRLMTESSKKGVIYAIEEPETSQHPHNQKILIEALADLANTGSAQIVLTSHNPSIVSFIPVDCLRFIEKDEEDKVIVYNDSTDEVLQKIVDSLGLLPSPIPQSTKALLLVEGENDVFFVEHTAQCLKEGGFLKHNFADKHILPISMGGCSSLGYWLTNEIAEQFNLPICVLLDSDIGNNQSQNIRRVKELNNKGVKAYTTRKREPENYIHSSLLPSEVAQQIYDDTDVKRLVAQNCKVNRDKVLKTYWEKMDCNLIREVEHYTDKFGKDRYEFTEMFEDFMSIV